MTGENMTGHPSIQNCLENILSNALLDALMMIDCQNCNGSCADEMKAIELISNSSNHKHFLVHPLISTFILLKWNQLAFLFHVYFIIYILFTLSTIGYIRCVINEVKFHIKSTFSVLTIILTVYVNLKRIMHEFHHLNSS